MYDSTNGLEDMGNVISSHTMTCADLDLDYTHSYGFNVHVQEW